MEHEIALVAALWGGASALSLPLGSALGLWLKPSRKITSALMAFGAGALLFALTLELFGHALRMAEDESGRIVHPLVLIVTIAAAVVGGLLFFTLNHLLEGQGAFLRKKSLLHKHLAKLHRERGRKLLSALGQIEYFRRLPIEEALRLLPETHLEHFAAGATIFRQGDLPECLYIIAKGEVRVVRGEEELALLGPGSVLAEMSLVSDHPHQATALALSGVRLYRISRQSFEHCLEGIPGLREELRAPSSALNAPTIKPGFSQRDAAVWTKKTLRRFDEKLPPADRAALAHSEHENSTLGIWLGNVLDGIPESLLVGMLAVMAAAEGGTMSLAFIVGVFVSNLPESMSSAVTMREGRMSPFRIVGMWSSLFVLAALGAFVGAELFPSDPSGTHLYLLYVMEGLASGAMLTMIAETMLPEAFERGGGPIVGLSTLAGFLCALSVKLIG